MPTSRPTKARWLALSLIAGRWDSADIADRLSRALPPHFAEVESVTARLRFHFDDSSPPSVDLLADYILSEPLLESVLDGSAINSLLLDPPVMGDMPDALITLPLPRLETWSDVASWLSLSDRELAWFSDCRSQQAKTSERKLHHYNYYWIPKRSGSYRLIEAPKSRLKDIQRKILTDLLNRVPPHSSSHGFSRGRSIRSYAAPHVGREVVLRFDLSDFFHSIPPPRIGALFRRLGYPKSVAWVLQGLCTTCTSSSLAGEKFEELPWDVRKRLESKHLAQGAPSSAQLANLCTWRFDCRLEGIADRFGLRYTRYADDLAFSGTHRLAHNYEFVEALVGAIAIEEGFRLNHRKTRLRLKSQRQSLAGIVVNEKANIRRADWETLKAILHNCIRHGPESQNVHGHSNFKAHLRGRVAHVSWLNQSRGQKLQQLWNSIDWDT